jgi:uncharacterized protein (TIGR04222 family)
MGELSVEPTWGIEGPDFLAWYLTSGFLLAVCIFLLRLFTGGLLPLRRRVDPHSLAPLDLAYLSGGPFHAVAVSHWLWTNPSSGQFSPEDRRFLDANWQDPLFQTVGRVAANAAATPKSCSAVASVQSHLNDRHTRLARLGLLRSRGVMLVLRVLKWAIILLLILGVVRVAAGMLNGRATTDLVGAVIAGLFALFVLAVKIPTITHPGIQALRELRRQNQDLRPDKPAGYSGAFPVRVALGAALFGTAGLWVAAPAYAAAMGIPAAGAGAAAGTYYGDPVSSSVSSSGSGGSSSCSGGGSCGGGGCGG